MTGISTPLNNQRLKIQKQVQNDDTISQLRPKYQVLINIKLIISINSFYALLTFLGFKFA